MVIRGDKVSSLPLYEVMSVVALVTAAVMFSKRRRREGGDPFPFQMSKAWISS